MQADAAHAYFKMSLHSKACIQSFISLLVLLNGWICGFIHQFVKIKKPTRWFPLFTHLCRWPQRFQVNIQKLRSTTDQIRYFHLQITGEFLCAPEHKSVLLPPCPPEEVTIKTNSNWQDFKFYFRQMVSWKDHKNGPSTIFTCWLCFLSNSSLASV